MPLDSTRCEAESILQSELFYKDSAVAMLEQDKLEVILIITKKLTNTRKSNTVVLERPIRMDICQQVISGEWC